MRLLSLLGGRELLVGALLLMLPIMAVSQSAPPGVDSTRKGSSNLRPGDLVLVSIWREPDLSDTVHVDNDGVAVFPKLGPIRVTGIPPDSLERLLVQQYSQYLQNPSIRVSVLRRITIFGAVVHPGPYPVDLTMTIPDALALAGGATPDGVADKVELRRGTTTMVVDLSGNNRIGDLSLLSGDQLVVPRRSWISRNPGFIMAGIGALTSILYLVRR